MEVKIFQCKEALELESGAVLPNFNIAYSTYGEYIPGKSKVVWVAHALTANSQVLDWWPGLFGFNCLFNPSEYFIVCANVLGSCYGSTSPLDINPNTQTPYYHDFPLLSIRDMSRGLDLLRIHLGIQKIHTLVGGSLGGQHVLEWAILQPHVFEHLIVMSTNAVNSPWAIALNETQRMAIEADQTWKNKSPEAGMQGMMAARAIALLSYRNYHTYQATQKEDGLNMLDHFKASSYQKYQGTKLTRKFNAFTYWVLSKAMDTHNVGRHRDGIEAALKSITAKTLVIGIDSDLLFPIHEQAFIAQHIEGAKLVSLQSLYGHDGFLVETDKISAEIERFYNSL